ncbi:hypothetical protein BAY61_05720 [Prauserella marina]|uniref:ABC-type nitrate/sulfonate/bicarbonate transport system, substrate-binding protein n=1 Tax=Prauserella marina TaxID=530584 RepID=A0A222VKW4_9PSEU|nr:ABC transporter substrate-binding protein [Prauserella marina]ASR34568.1 hypothetical protein BAY61_05720 [Prauserella marina]PWV85811.1 ABC-type nitrate/sulfonate/bicarbonate transport system substrate-binding protein [Prauserella marina]SDC44920.1 ABC-type nitrate/sulfonate/bicarbonate transport system, substrate-binding protein [Prauserella marina]
MGYRRRATAIVALLLGAAGLAGCGGSTPSADEGASFVYGTVSTGIVSREVMAADKLGYLDEAGVDLSVKKLQSDTMLTPLMANGETSIGYLTYVTTVTALRSGIPLRMVSGIQELEPDIQTVWVPKDSPVTSIADFKGKTIGVSAVGGYGNVLFGEALATEGLTLEDVTLTEVSFSDMASALERGDIDLGWLPAPFAAAQRANPDTPLRQVVDFNDIPALTGLPQGGVVATAEFYEQNPETIGKFREQEKRAADYLRENPDYDRELQKELAGYEPSVTSELPLQGYAGSFSADDLERLLTLMTKYGLLEEGDEVDLGAFVGDLGNAED